MDVLTWDQLSRHEWGESNDVVAGHRSFFRRDELVLDAQSSELLAPELERQRANRGGRFEDRLTNSRLDIEVWKWDGQPDIPDLVRWLRSSGRVRDPRRRPIVTPNYCLRGTPKWHGGPADAPRRPPQPGTLTQSRPVTEQKSSPHLAILDTGVFEQLPP